MEPFKVLNKIKSEQLSEIDFKSDMQKARKREEWDKNRNEILDDVEKCQWCGSNPDEIHIHHKWSKSFGREWMKSTDEAFIDSSSYNESLTKNRKQCPNCNKKNYYSRKTKEPEYRCNNCSEEFNNLEVVEGGCAIKDDSLQNKPYTTYEYFVKKANWTSENKETVKEYFMSRYDKLLDEYVSMREDQVIPICGKCHFLEEQTKKKRCSECEVNWYDPSKIRDNMCWDCVVDKKGLEKCPECEESWYNPDKNDACKSCG